ncbi:MAG: hypothetical protein JO261_09715 [Alphaproteobacteria bacterium]|nr:hypothetical protein [Alphaproteobacteria bacterium]MBV9693966.1 hypothetical protein [Alphaproteobacteria bacterium]
MRSVSCDASAAPRLRLNHARIAKAQSLGGSNDGDASARERRGAQTTRRQAYRFETAGASPWNGPLLDPRYAAQVIGQAVASRSRHAGAYPGLAPTIAPMLFDRSY